MPALENQYIKEQLQTKFPELAFSFEEDARPFSFTISNPELNLRVLQFLYDEPSLQFRFLTDLCAVHYPQNKDREICVVYHLHNMIDNKRLSMKIYVPISQPNVFTASNLFATANWMERETYDFFGVNFIGHPNLIRILNADEMTYFPLRKEYPLQDGTRLDKDDEMFGRTMLNK